MIMCKVYRMTERREGVGRGGREGEKECGGIQGWIYTYRQDRREMGGRGTFLFFLPSSHPR